MPILQRAVQFNPLVLVYTIAVVLLASMAWGAAVTPSAGVLAGVVTDEKGVGVSGATVYAEQQESRIITSGHSDANGHFEIPLKTVGVHRVTVSRKGFSSADSKVVKVTSSPIGSINLVAKSTPPGTGVIADATSEAPSNSTSPVSR